MPSFQIRLDTPSSPVVRSAPSSGRREDLPAMSEAAPRSSEILRPRDAATLIIVRRGKNGGEVLMGERSAAHVFVPENYVFPGGRVDRSDAFVQPATPLRPDVLERMSRSATPRRALALDKIGRDHG